VSSGQLLVEFRGGFQRRWLQVEWNSRLPFDFAQGKALGLLLMIRKARRVLWYPTQAQKQGLNGAPSVGC
jgi:hypothetical protein